MSSLPPDSASVPLFPLFADLRTRAVLVVGGGAVARRKVEALLEAGAEVTVGSMVLDPQLAALAAVARIQHRAGAFVPAWLDGMWLVVAATGDAEVNRRVAAAAEARRLFVNAVDDAEASSFHVPARVRRGPVQIAISSGGAAPVLAQRLRQRLELELDESLATLAELLARARAKIRARFPHPGARRRFFERLLDGEWPARVRTGDSDAQACFEHALHSGNPQPRGGRVTLVGAGPGDPGLLTLKALRALKDADVIVHDRLVGAEVLELARRDAERIDAGKRVGEDHDATQARIHELLLRHARAGHHVVRLQGGDPLVFGRGGEEIEFLRAQAVPVAVIPGITAALAAAAGAGMALTDRRHSRSVTLVSPRGETALDPAALAAPGQTLAVYMGVGELESLCASLIEHGRAADTPCVLVERASLPGERQWCASLATLPALARAHGAHAPALLIVGEVAAQARRPECAERCRDGIPAIAHAA